MLSIGAGPVAGANEVNTTEAGAVVALDEIVVTATRREESISRVPISITALSREMLDQKGIKGNGTNSVPFRL
jgi:outer membrane receptor protein involved in Fe transport